MRSIYRKIYGLSNIDNGEYRRRINHKLYELNNDIGSVNKKTAATPARSSGSNEWKHSKFESVRFKYLLVEAEKEEDLHSFGKIRWKASWFRLVFLIGAKLPEEETKDALLLIRLKSRKRCLRQCSSSDIRLSTWLLTVYVRQYIWYLHEMKWAVFL